VSDRVRFLGRLADGETYREMAKCDVFVMPCRLLKERFGEEGFGIVFLEAAALGKPVVAGRSGGAPEAVVDGDTGILVDPESVVSLAQALERLILDGDLRGRLGAAGLLRVRKSFQWTNRVDDFLSRLS
jgi:phosphatidylinositol alpha-1,6-mannosyltransferase